jgi:hypothetical protein
MNIANAKLLVARLRSPSIAGHFDLESFVSTQGSGNIGSLIHTCGTTACIAGHAVAIAHPDLNTNGWLDYGGLAQDWLELDDAQHQQLFIPDTNAVDYGLVTSEIAADVVATLIATGEVEWPEEVWI